MTRPLLLLALLLAGSGLLLADQSAWPQPAEGWWSQLVPDQQASYVIRDGALTLRRTYEIDGLEGDDGEVLTLSVNLEFGEQRLPKHTRTLDARSMGFPPPLAGQQRELRRESIELAGRSWPCTVYQLRTDDETLTVWRSEALPPVFAGGCVRLQRQGETSSVVELERYSGP